MYTKWNTIRGVIALCTLSYLPLAAQWTPEFSLQFKNITGVSLSPDGKYAAYAVSEPVTAGEKSEYLQQIWVSALDGSLREPYTHSEKSSFAPAFSPDGQKIAFISARSGKNQIWVMRLLGGEAEMLTDVKKGVAGFQWAPDGRTIAFLSADSDSEAEEKARKEKRDAWVVDENFKYRHLYTIPLSKDADGKRAVRRLTQGAFYVNDFDWSPDSKTIVFSHKPDPTINAGYKSGDISLVPADSGAVTPLVSWAGVDQSPKYSPDGKYIAFSSSGKEPALIGLQDLYVVPAAGGAPIPMPLTPDRNASLLGWSADGQQLLFAESLQTSGTAMRMPVGAAIAGKKSAVRAQALCPLEGTSNNFSMAATQNLLAYVYQTPDKPAELYVSGLDGSNPRAVSQVNSQVALPKMGKTEVIRWKSSDGLEVEGLLTYPVDYEPGKKYPMALQIHGGPAGVFSKSFTGAAGIYLNQYFAQQGMFVLRPNPRGSVGYGKDFRYGNYKDWGFGDYEDVMSGVDHVIQKGLADSSKLAVMGWSYGGYLTSYLVTKTNRFKAASVGAGLTNLISMFTTNDIPEALVGYFGVDPWDDFDLYEKHSAIYHVKEVTTPTQIVHGAEDQRVPISQGQEFYTALRRLGIPSEMVILPRTPHGPQEPKLLIDVSPRIMKWFDTFLNIKP